MRPLQSSQLAKTLHELKVHQGELETQNQKLLETRDDAEQAVDKYFSLFEYAPIGYLTHDNTWKILSVNGALSKMFGLKKIHIIGKCMSIFIDKEDLPLFLSFTRQCRQSKVQAQTDIHIRLPKKTILVQLSTVRIPDRITRDLYHTAVINITERRQLENELKKSHQELEEKVVLRTRELEDTVKTLKEESAKRKKVEQQLIQSQKMESIGLLAGGIAHDFNNLLTIILGYSLKLQRNLPLNNPLVREYINQVLEGARRATELTKNLLAFSRRQNLNLQTVSVDELISDVIEFTRRIIGEDIQFQTSLPKRKLYITADATQIDQVLVNLFTNARDAMPKGGKISISAKSIRVKKGKEKLLDLPSPGPYVLVSVSDSGIGINEEAQRKIFEPFYTTKGPWKGTGLGLSTAYGIIKQHGGSICFKSEVNKGTTFYLYFPLTENIQNNINVKKSRTVISGKETLLVVEDEKMVRSFLKETLEEAGYKVIVAKNGEEAVKRFKRCNNISLILSDIIMPKKNGEEMFKEIREINSNIKAIFLSGYTGGLIQSGSSAPLGKGTAFLSKPFTEDDLLKKVRKALDM